MRPLNLQEAAEFLRMSKSSLYQRKDIPHYRRPGSRALLFDQDELEAWVRTGRTEPAPITESTLAPPMTTQDSSEGIVAFRVVPQNDDLDNQTAGVYHRNPRYR